MKAYNVVADFEAAVAEWVGAKHGVSVDSGTSALFLAFTRAKALNPGDGIARMPAHTFMSVPMAAMHAGWKVSLIDVPWIGQYGIGLGMGHATVQDSAGQLGQGSYISGAMCVSFQYRKPVPIGKGGMILTDSAADADWFRRARYFGRDPAAPFDLTKVTMAGWNMTMTPDAAARGLALLELSPPTRVFRSDEYQDLRACPLFQ